MIRNKKVDYINEVTTAISRYYDAGNRIIDNRQEIIDFAEAQITVDHLVTILVLNKLINGVDSVMHIV